jgi:hypothetical protein
VPNCSVCKDKINPGEPIAWGGPQQQLHERCLAAPRVNRQEWVAAVSATTAIVDLFRADPQERLCLACVALRAGTSLEDAQRAAPALESQHGFAREQQSCGGCGREVDVIYPVSAASR